MSRTRRNKAASQPAGKPPSKIWGWARAALLAGGGIVVGFVTSYWVQYRSDYRSALEDQMEAYRQVSAPVSDKLRDFFLIAQGRRVKSESDVESLRRSLYASTSEAQLLADRIGKDGLLHEYQAAVVAVQKASQSVTGPIDAKPLMQAVNDYLSAEQNLQIAAQESYASLI